ncbi:uncharacterized protein LOC129959168 [Argiope bruennichi]|uniref:uncharacterized protein LOC129959168 n=1 Tax=Argiope bruennichi TaxID=94029 RepID=UPI0024943572|nr:uncharacterized protein LOC129959168 [Argiope bruennichi]
MVLSSTEPCEDRAKIPIKVFYSAGSYEKARRKLKRAEETSNLSSDSDFNENRRKRRRKYEDPIENIPTTSRHNPQILVTSHCAPNNPPPVTPHLNSQVSSSNEGKTFQRKVLRMLEEIKEDQAELHSMIQSLTKAGSCSAIPEECVLPVNSPEDLNLFNEYLYGREKFSQICTYFGSFGGHTYNSLVRRILQTVMTNEVSLQYNWKGTGGIKLAFQNFQNIIQMISDLGWYWGV